jgi:hypothetical protein
MSKTRLLSTAAVSLVIGAFSLTSIAGLASESIAEVPQSPLETGAGAPAGTLRASFNQIPNQIALYMFQVDVTVTDANGKPAPGQRVSIRLSPYKGGHFTRGLFGKVTLRAPTGLKVDDVSATTNNEGVASILLKVSDSSTPKKIQLFGAVGDAENSTVTCESNTFGLFAPENYSEW